MHERWGKENRRYDWKDEVMNYKMSFLDSKPRIATAEDIKANWLGEKNGIYFKCALCGYKFKEGDIYRCVYSNDTIFAPGNPIVCKECDTGDFNVIEKWAKMHEEARTRMWWFCRHYD